MEPVADLGGGHTHTKGENGHHGDDQVEIEAGHEGMHGVNATRPAAGPTSR